jgi:UDP-N-acetylglucosamine 2-epimerase (non-hydrolysing)
MKKTIVTITGIRPDFIRMCFVFKELDKHFNHILIHTGQHYDKNLSNIFFEELNIREPDYILETGINSTNHFEQLSYLTTAIPNLFKEKNIQPDLILFLGDSNSAGVSFPLKKAGYKIGHIEAGMRSYDKRMLEEINRTVCDHCSDILFVYHDDYKKQLELENITKNVFVVGNTIVEPLLLFKENIFLQEKKKDIILMDIHRPENFNYKDRLQTILLFGNECIKKYNIPVKLLYFKRLKDSIEKWNLELGNIEMVPLLPYKEYLETVYHSKFIISDSGTGQEEPALLNTPVVVPRDFTERPQSYENNCSIKLKLCEEYNSREVIEWLENIDDGVKQIDSKWLGDGNTSNLIIDKIKLFLDENN